MTESAIRRVDVLGVGISAINPKMALAEIERWIVEGERQYVCVTGVHGVMESQRDPDLKRIHNLSGMTTPDGMPMVWAGRKAGAGWISRVYGPDLMLDTLRLAAQRGWSSFLYGGREGVPELLAQRLGELVPEAKIAGTYSPPFRDLTSEEQAHVVALINSSGADLVWVGLSTPKQERWMAEYREQLRPSVLLGVGAAFDFHAGLVPQAPSWMQERGMEWAFRMMKEPRRLGRRYLVNNPAFLRAIRRTPPYLRSCHE